MILIIADESDLSSNMVVDWLKYFEEDFIHIDSSIIVKFYYIELSNSSYDYFIEINEKKFSIKDLKSCFIRRGN